MDTITESINNYYDNDNNNNNNNTKLNVTFIGTEVDFNNNSNNNNSNNNTLNTTNITTTTGLYEEYKKQSVSLDYRLPSSVNFIALRESLLSEAPFITKYNKNFWRKLVDNIFYQNILSAIFRHVLNCISDNGNVNIDKLLQLYHSEYTRIMSNNISELIFKLKLKDRDLFFAKLPEITTFMIIEALHTSTPKHYRIYNSIKFREILLDYTSELISGIRLSNCKFNREWLFASAQDSNIMTSETLKLPNIHSNNNSPKNTLKNNKSLSSINNNNNNNVKLKNQTPATSLYCIEHSPLVRIYMGLNNNKPPVAGGLGFKVAMSHSAERPLTVMNEYALLRKGKTYNRICDRNTIKKTLKESLSVKNDIMKQFNETTDATKADLRRIRDAYHTYIDQLNNKSVSKARLVQAMQASHANTMNSNT